jgi:hypothetical protein
MNGAKPRRGKQPYALALADRGLMELAGVWENWQSPAGEWMRSFAIITTTPNELCAEIHNRMPVILKPEAWPAWLGEKPAEVPQLKALLAPYGADGFELPVPQGRPDKQRKQSSAQFLCGDRASEFARLAAGGLRFEPLGPRSDKTRSVPWSHAMSGSYPLSAPLSPLQETNGRHGSQARNVSPV